LIADTLSRKIARRIRAEGPLSVAAYMAMALHDPDEGYYAGRDPIGAQGDFITAPEISQVFGELIGLWCAVVWCQLGRPDPVILAELGPGRGVLVGDLLRAAATVPDFSRALRLHLVEASALLRAAQQQRLAPFEAIWVPRFEDLPDGSMLLVANEFLDALPIRQFVCHGPHWSERMVTVDDEDRFVFVEGSPSPVAALLVPQCLRLWIFSERARPYTPCASLALRSLRAVGAGNGRSQRPCRFRGVRRSRSRQRRQNPRAGVASPAARCTRGRGARRRAARAGHAKPAARDRQRGRALARP
jgi:hypothetical protein